MKTRKKFTGAILIALALLVGIGTLAGVTNPTFIEELAFGGGYGDTDGGGWLEADGDIVTDGDITGTALNTTGAVTVAGVNGINYAPGSDIDVDVMTVNVTGAPKIWWDESHTRFAFGGGANLWVPNITVGTDLDVVGALTAGTITSDAGIALADKIIGSAAITSLVLNTSDGSDTKQVRIGGGGNTAWARGGNIIVSGNEHATDAGNITLQSGNVTGSEILFDARTARVLTLAHALATFGVDLDVTGDLIVDGGDIGLTADTNLIQIAANAAKINGSLEVTSNLRTATQTPASASATGSTGTIAWDASYIYICTATDTWKRVAISTW